MQSNHDTKRKNLSSHAAVPHRPNPALDVVGEGHRWIVGRHRTEAERVLPRVEAALGLIKTHDRQRYDRIVADLDRVWVRLLTTYVAQFSPSWSACFLDERFVLGDTTDAAHIAAAIVHEATHARLWRCGFGYDEEVRQRVEAVCVRREVAFANKLPDGERIRA